MDCISSYLAYKKSCNAVVPVMYRDTGVMTLDELTEYVSELIANAVSVVACRNGRVKHREKCVPQEEWDEGHQHQIDLMDALLSEYEQHITTVYMLLEQRIAQEEKVEPEVFQAEAQTPTPAQKPLRTQPMSRTRRQKRETPEERQERILEPVIIRHVDQERIHQLLRRSLSSPNLIPIIVREAIAQKKTNILRRLLPVISYSKSLSETQREQILRDILAYGIQNNLPRFVKDFFDATHWIFIVYSFRGDCLQAVHYHRHINPDIALRYKAMDVYWTILTSTYRVFVTHNVDLSCVETHDTITKLISYNERHTPSDELMNDLIRSLVQKMGTHITIDDVVSVLGKSILDVYSDAFLDRIENTDYLQTLPREELQDILDKLKIIENRAGHLKFVKSMLLPSSRIRTLVELRKRAQRDIPGIQEENVV